MIKRAIQLKDDKLHELNKFFLSVAIGKIDKDISQGLIDKSDKRLMGALKHAKKYLRDLEGAI